MAARTIIYEDNDLLRESLRSMLTLNDRVIVCGDYKNPSQIVEQTRREKPDLILMDIDMPEVNGIDAVKRIRAVDQRVSIIMLTVLTTTITCSTPFALELRDTC